MFYRLLIVFISFFVLSGCSQKSKENTKANIINQLEQNSSNPTPATDSTPPTLKLNGAKELNVTKGSSYKELGAVATDNVDKDIKVEVIGKVDVNKEGSYKIIYKATDKAGNSSTVTRFITVIPPILPPKGEKPKKPTIVNLPISTNKSHLALTIEAKANTFLFINDKSYGEVDSSGKININLPIEGIDGKKEFKVYIKDSNNIASDVLEFTIIKDTTPPIIKLNGNKELNITKGSTYQELGAVASDNLDGNLQVTIEGSVDFTKIGTYTITYKTKDKAGNEDSISRVVNVILPADTTPPTITLNGESEVNVILGESYSELGAVATDNIDSDVNITTSGSVNIAKMGDYNITYSATDKAGNSATKVRAVHVVSPEVLIKNLDVNEIKCNSWANIKVGENTFNNNDWGRQYLSEDKDGVQCIFSFSDNKELKGGWLWAWPNNDDNQVKGYPEAIYGAKFKRVLNPESGFPALVEEIKSVNVNIAFRDLNYTKRYNTALEFWLHTSKDTSMDNIEYEIMFRFDPNGFHPNKTKIGTYTISGVVYDVYKDRDYVDGESNRIFINFVAQSKTNSISVDFKKVLDYLTNLEFKDIPQRYMSGVEMGVEMISGSGVLLLDEMSVNLSKVEQNLTKAVNSGDLDSAIKISADNDFLNAQIKYQEYFGANLPQKTIDAFNKHPELKKALSAVTSKSGLELFVLNNFSNFLEEFKDVDNIEKYYNIFFGYAVQSGSSGIYNDKVFWDGWGDFVGLYGAHRTWSVDDKELFKKAEASIAKDGTFGDLPTNKIKYFAFYLSEKYNLDTVERELIRNSNGKYYNRYLKSAIAKGVNLETEPLSSLVKNYDLQLPVINTYLKIKGKEPRAISELKSLIDNFMSNNNLTTYKDYMIAYDSGKLKEAIKDDHLGKKYAVWSMDTYLRKVIGLDKQASLYAMSGLKLAKRVIRLYEDKTGLDYFPLLKDDITKRPWHLYALDEGSDQKGCEWVEKRFFEDNEATRKEMIKNLGEYINLNEKKWGDRLITYSHYGKEAWKDPNYWYQGSNYHPQLSVPTIVRQGGICGQLGTLEQHSRSCLGQPTLGRAEPGHRDLVLIEKNSDGEYEAKIHQGAVAKAYKGTNLAEPYRNSFDNQTRAMGGERVEGIINGLTESENGFDSSLTDAMILQRLALKYPDKTEDILRKAIDLYLHNPSIWYQLSQYYAKNNQEQKVIDLAKNYMGKLDEIKIDKVNKDSVAANFKKATAWGIVEALVANNTPNAIDLSLNFIDENLPTGFILTGYKEMFKLIKENKKTNWKEQSQKVFEHMLKNYSLEKSPESGFLGNADNYWDNDSDFINQMRDLVLNSATASDTFKRNILKNIFKDNNVFISQVKFIDDDFKLSKSIKISDSESKNLYITTNDFPNHVGSNLEGKEGYKILNIPVIEQNGAKATLKLRVAKKVNDKLYYPNDSTVAVSGKTEFIFWFDKSDNKDITQGTYSTKKAVIISHKGHKKSTYYSIGESTVVISNLKVAPTSNN